MDSETQVKTRTYLVVGDKITMMDGEIVTVKALTIDGGICTEEVGMVRKEDIVVKIT